MYLSKSTLAIASAITLTACGEAPKSSEEKTIPPVILDKDEGTLIAFPLHETRELAGPNTNIAGMSFFELKIPANSAGAPPHTHSNEDEFFYLRKGSLTFMAGDTRRTITAGGFVMLPRNGMHAFWNDTEEESFVLVGTSEGKFGDFFDAVAIEVRNTQAASPQEIGEILGKVSVERGITIDMSKLPPDVATLYGAP